MRRWSEWGEKKLRRQQVLGFSDWVEADMVYGKLRRQNSCGEEMKHSALDLPEEHLHDHLTFKGSGDQQRAQGWKPSGA